MLLISIIQLFFFFFTVKNVGLLLNKKKLTVQFVKISQECIDYHFLICTVWTFFKMYLNNLKKKIVSQTLLIKKLH